ncbi:MAG TPA: bifunctional glutamate N-acetyltransferase/amino-acid acetyltransferase ArgJ [Candidatus Competibacteraceae bacterium]|nr:bifunctional glutamate N-acetyltransferase/amino-acid acetyltransferase ArgJ [Candidatus Competibacteraceae bacterium]HRZ05309.1 bifunctional glutamate N-acetyltransferase/amino-acid acetyltransferase ArgJ [Candidatus Competibacteraceae bacterium]
MEPFIVAGVRLGVARAGIKYPDRRDLVVIEVAAGTQAAAVFTQNAFCAAPVIVARAHLAVTAPRYLVINTGNANAGTGVQGLTDAEATCRALAKQTGCRSEEVLPFSTGVIGEPLPVERLVAGLPAALASLQAEGWTEAAHGIMTTDTWPKWASQRLMLNGREVTVTGIAKGAGMICPNMATMLAFVATDAAVDQALLQHILNAAVADSFNAITVDGDTSTNDALVLLATGQSGATVPTQGEDYACFSAAVRAVCIELAQAIIRDGEGATKFITVQVEGGRDSAECRQVAYTIAHSPLVKTAFFAADPNWGRILAAVGRAGLTDLDLERVSIHLDEICIVCTGGRAPDYTEAQGQQVMARPDITIRVELGRGAATARIWTTDFSFDYVRINAEYRT